MDETHHVGLHHEGVRVHLKEGGQVVAAAADLRQSLLREGISDAVEQCFRDKWAPN